MNQTDTPAKVASNDQLGRLPEPLFLLHTGAMYDGERSDWDVEANSGGAVDALANTHPGQTLGLYSAPQVLAMLAAERERCASMAENYDLGTPDGQAIAACIRGA